MRDAVRKAARFVLGLMLIASVIGWGVSARAFLRIPFVERTADWSRAVIAAEVTRQTTMTVTPDWVDSNLTEALSDEPRDWPRISVIEELAADHRVLLKPATRAARDRAFQLAQLSERPAGIPT